MGLSLEGRVWLRMVRLVVGVWVGIEEFMVGFKNNCRYKLVILFCFIIMLSFLLK